MIIKYENKSLTLVSENDIQKDPYQVLKGKNGRNYVTFDSVSDNLLNVSEGNSKTGEKCINFNMSIEYTCNHSCECYKNATCYACSGCYLFANNQAKYTENYKFYCDSDNSVFTAALQLAIDTTGYKFFRYFTCGDIPDKNFIGCMVTLAKNNPDVKFWSYTKKYGLVNSWIDENGMLPENMVIVFSHWMNDDGSFFPMNNKYNIPTSEFIPFGQEEKAKTVTHICPCSDPSVNVTCLTCDHACYTLKPGESMALLEHSTKATKERDKAIHAAKKALPKKQ